MEVMNFLYKNDFFYINIIGALVAFFSARSLYMGIKHGKVGMTWLDTADINESKIHFFWGMLYGAIMLFVGIGLAFGFLDKIFR